MRSRVLAASLLAIALVVGGACSSDDTTADDASAPASGNSARMDDMPMGDGTSTSIAVDIPDGAEFNATDVAFAQGMIPHHAQAIVMADMALVMSDDAEIIALAEQIEAAQQPEIDQMVAWLTEWGQTVPDPEVSMDENMSHAGEMMMSGMMSEADMSRLSDATGDDFDRMFAEMMILHHEGAIEMAEQALAGGKYQPLRDLAQAVITTQHAEIDQMNDLLSGL